MSNDKRNWKEITVDTNGEIWDMSKPIEGEYVTVEHDIGPKKSNLYTIRTDAGDVKVWGSMILDEKLSEILQGTYIKIEYTGKERSKSGNEYHTYKLFIDEDTSKVTDVTGGELLTDADMPPDFLKG